MARMVWTKSSYSGTHNCVEVGRISDCMAVRDTKNHADRNLTATLPQWSTFIAALKHGRFDS
ncbi:DUF397 domain-containing protein [Saccharopolyspora sp. K220]|uniref:DUF397 domain-containing protein n=1 Tax=Saccharopolyspora soli TaxID=2926618 RepID=UPI001F565BDA|nr:DUF397 domain-containing protein [Saccharopolyspora soli]MCI2424017.1 DUF397 domain-containing protein [Saccharopolyspora soli]